MSYLILVISIIFNAGSGIFLKYAVMPPFGGEFKGKLLMMAGFLCGAISAILYTKSLSDIHLGTAATISAGMVIVVSNIAGVLLFQEDFNISKIIGAVLVCIGIYLVLR